MSSFEVAIEFQPYTPLDVLVSEHPGCSVGPIVYKFVKTWKDLLDEARDSLKKASRWMKKYANQGRRPLEFEEGEKVLLKLTP